MSIMIGMLTNYLILVILLSLLINQEREKYINNTKDVDMVIKFLCDYMGRKNDDQ